MLYNKRVKYISQTFSYLKKNLPPILLVMAVPSLVACFFATPYWEVCFSAHYNGEPILTFANALELVFDDFWEFYLWPVVLTSALQIVASSLIMSAIDRHFRTAKMSLRSPFRLINVSIVPILFGVLVMSAVGILFRFVLFGLVSLAQSVGLAAQMSYAGLVALIAVISFALMFLHVVSIIPMLYWAPMMFVYGYGLRDAAAYSFKMIAGKKVSAGIIVPIVLCAGVQLLVGFLAPTAVIIIVSFFVYLFTNSYLTVYVIVSFYGVSELERRDVVAYMPIVTEPVKPTEKDDKSKNKTDERSDYGEDGEVKEGSDVV